MLRKSMFVAALALLPALAVAQPRQADWEMTLSGVGSSDRNMNSGSFGLNVGVGTYVTDQILVSLRSNLTYMNPHPNVGGGTFWAQHTRIAGDYHFDFDVWQPFVGASLGYQSGDLVRDSFTAGGQGGVKYYVNNRTFIFGMAEYLFSLRGGGESWRRGAWLYSTGIGFNW
jgi:hypothetical protein